MQLAHAEAKEQPLSYCTGLARGHGAGGHMNTYACRFHIKLMFRRGHAIGGESIALPFGA